LLINKKSSKWRFFCLKFQLTVFKIYAIL